MTKFIVVEIASGGSSDNSQYLKHFFIKAKNLHKSPALQYIQIFIVLYFFLLPNYSLSLPKNQGSSKYKVRFLTTSGTWKPLCRFLKASGGNNCTSAKPRQTTPEHINKGRENRFDYSINQ